MKKIYYTIVFVTLSLVMLNSCKKGTSTEEEAKTSFDKNALSKDIKNLFAFSREITSSSKGNIETTVLSDQVSQDALIENKFKDYANQNYPGSLTGFTTIITKFKNIKFNLPGNSNTKDNGDTKMLMHHPDDEISSEELNDIPLEVNTYISNPVIASIGASTVVSTALENIQNDIAVKTQDFLTNITINNGISVDQKYNTFKNDVISVLYSNNTDVNSIPIYSNSERDALSIAIFCAIQSISNLNTPNFTELNSVIVESINKVQSAGGSSHTQSLGSWLKRNILKPIITAVTVVVVNIGIIAVAAIQGAAIGGPIGIAVGLIAGFAADITFLNRATYNFLHYIDMYDHCMFQALMFNPGYC